MNFLLDTHVWLWSLLEPHLLNSATKVALANPSYRFYLSPITTWETLLLAEKKRILIHHSNPQQWVLQSVRSSNVFEAPLTHEVAIRSRQLQVPHQDPADRFIAATALEYGLTLMTADSNLLNSPQLVTWSVA